MRGEQFVGGLGRETLAILGGADLGRETLAIMAGQGAGEGASLRLVS
jgi:hypothetical protein